MLWNKTQYIALIFFTLGISSTGYAFVSSQHYAPVVHASPNAVRAANIVNPAQDGPPTRTIDISKIPDPIPRKEPISLLGNPLYYEVYGRRYYVDKSSKGYHSQGYASWYGTKFHGKRTSSGEAYDMFAMTAANRTLPIPCYVRVTNLENGHHVIVRVNDRGPFHDGRIIDLSYAAAKKLEMLQKGTAYVQVESLAPHQFLPNEIALAGTTKPPAKSNTNLYLQIGAFGERSNAEHMAADIRRIVKYPVSISQVAYTYGQMYRVKIGPLLSLAESDKINNALKAAGLSHGVLTEI